MALLLSTGNEEVIIADLGNVKVPANSTDIDISYFGLEHIRKSQSLCQLIQQGKITLKDKDNNLLTETCVANLDYDQI